MSNIAKRITDLSPEKLELLLQQKRKKNEKRTQAILPQKRETNIFPLSFTQQRLWFFEQWEPGSPLYTISLPVRLTGELSVEVLEQAIHTLIKRHEVLHTTFTTLEEQPVQVIDPALTISLPIVDLEGLAVSVRETYIQHLAVEEARLPFDLTKGPLVRMHLLRQQAQHHLLLLTMHHIISDGWSLSIFVRELASLYTAFSTRRSSPLPELTIQYADFTIWQRDWLRGEVLEQQLAYWKQQLHEAPAMLELPTDHPRPAIQAFRGTRYTFTLPRVLSVALQALSNREGVTLFMTLLAAFQALLFRYTGQEDILVGTPIANRTHSEIEHIIGSFINTLVLRTNLSGNPGFRELLKRVREVTLSAYAHQDLPFEKLVEELQPERNLSHTPFFQVMFILRNAARSVQRIPDLILQTEEIDNGTAKFDITLTMTEAEQGLLGTFEYKTDLFEATTIARIAQQFQELLTGIVNQPEQRLASLPLLTAAEQQQMLVEWNNTLTGYPRNACLHHFIEAQVERTPDAIAVAYEDGHLSYQELNRQANQLAHYLQRLGVGPETCVGLCLERSLAMTIGLLAILKAGGAFVPLDPNYPTERLAFMLADAQISLLLTQQALLADVQEKLQDRQHALSTQIIYLDTCWQVIVEESEENPASLSLPENLAYVIYTSGSTGRPRGVMIPHQGLVNYLYWCSSAYEIEVGNGALVHTSVGFDLTLTSLLAPLLKGQRLTLLPDSEEVGALASALHAGDDWSLLKLTPTHLELLSKLLPEENIRNCARTLIIGGEALHSEYVSFWRSASPGTKLINEYGPTETVVGCCVYEIPDPMPTTGTMPIGRPIANTQLYVLDSHLCPVPIGVSGELYIGGDGLARGYFMQPELTAERFVPNPFSLEPGLRLYRTGDIARYQPDGTLEYLGRNDEQIKLRGFRIEPGEIASVLMEHTAIHAAVVLLHEEIPGDKRLVAYIVPRGEQPLDLTDIRSFLKERLPAYMIPAVFVQLDTLPLTFNGKVDRQMLSSLGQIVPATSQEQGGALTPAEEILVGIWSNILGVERVGINDDFFELGGHSLLAIRLISRLREVFQVDLPLRSLFETPTIAMLALTIQQLKDAQSGQQTISWSIITPLPYQRYLPFPLTDVQQAYWIGRTESFELGNVATHIYIELESTGLDVARLNRAWQRLIERHDMLRAIVLPDGQQQILERVPPYAISVLDLREQDAQKVTSQLEDVREVMSHQMLPTDKWPLFDLRATYLDKERIRLHLSADALMIDAGSWQILVRELTLLYENLDLSLPPLELSFRDYVLAERAFCASEIYQRALEYWHNRLPTLPPAPELPLTQNPASLAEPHFVRREARLEPTTWSSLKNKAVRAGLTPSALLLAAFAEILATWSRKPQFTINLTLFNRLPLHPQVSEVIGDFTSLTLLEVDYSQPDTFVARARRLQQRLWEDLDARYVSGISILRELARTSERNTQAIMPVVFTSTLTQERSAPVASPLGKMIYGISQTPQVWLDHQVGEQRGALIYNWDAVEELFPPGLLDDMFSTYHHFLLSLAETDKNWLQETRQQVPAYQLEQRAKINNTTAPIPSELLHAPFCAQVSLRPYQPAVTTPGRILTYKELYLSSHWLGHLLRKMGAVPNTLIAVVMEKGWEQIVAVLGILQSGAAYLPIDATLPRERLWYLLKHGEVNIVLTQSRLLNELEWPEAIQLFCVDDASLNQVDDSPLPPTQKPEDLAYVIYTSGSTGSPKGVMIEHRGAINTIIDINERFGIGPKDRVLALSSLSFDLSVYDIFGLLAAGGTIVLPEATRLRDPAHWAQLIRQENITLWNTVPALMEMLVEYIADRPEYMPGSLLLALLSGDWIPLSLPNQVKSLAPNVQVISLGGATEASIWSILYPIQTMDASWRSIPYGRPMLNQWFHILNEHLEPCPTWVPGRLYIGGIGLARGYWRDEEKTRASFIQHPLTRERLYYTGDLGRYLPDGTIEFLGREDFQVKIQGYRIELGEIEAALSQHPAIRAAIVTASEKFQRNKHLVAYIVLDEAVTTDELRIFLQEKLPAYMVPTSFMVLDTLPLTANGKVDRTALPEPTQINIAPEFRAGNMPFIQHVDSIVARILHLNHIDPEDNLLDLGANSIDIIRIVNVLEHELHFRPNIADFLRQPTIVHLSQSYELHRYQNQEPPGKRGTAKETDDPTILDSDAFDDREEGEL